MNDATIRRPTHRTCELCGRAEEWSADSDAWRVVREDGDPQVGDLYCIHEWDINGTFVPIENPDNGAQA